MKGNIKIEAADKRNFTVLPNHIIRCGGRPSEVMVLAIIASYAWEGSACTASIATIAEAAGVKRNTVCEAIKLWEERGQLIVERFKGKGTKIKTKFDFTATSIPWDTSIQVDTAPVSDGIPQPVSRGIHKEDTLKKTKKKTNDITPPAAATVESKPIVSRETSLVVERPDADIIAVFDVFRDTISPAINYGNKTQREAAKILCQKYGVEKVVAAARYAVTNFGNEMVPAISNPHELREKFARLIRHAQNDTKVIRKKFTEPS